MGPTFSICKPITASTERSSDKHNLRAARGGGQRWRSTAAMYVLICVHAEFSKSQLVSCIAERALASTVPVR